MSLAVYEWFYITAEAAETIPYAAIKMGVCAEMDAEDSLPDSRDINLTEELHAALQAGMFVPIICQPDMYCL